MNMPPHKVCEQICALHAHFATLNAQFEKFLKLLEANQLKGSDLPEFFYRLGVSTTKPLPQENTRKRIFRLHAQIAATKHEWSIARKKLLRLLDNNNLSWAFDLPAILAAVWFENNPQNASTSAAAASATASATPPVDVYELNKAVIEDRVVMSMAENIVSVLWVLNTYKYRTFDYVPQIGLISPASGCGKSRALKTFKCLVANPWLSDHATAPSIYRRLRRQSHTCLLNEAENQGLLQDKKLRALLDAAFEHDGQIDFTEDESSVGIGVRSVRVGDPW